MVERGLVLDLIHNHEGKLGPGATEDHGHIDLIVEVDAALIGGDDALVEGSLNKTRLLSAREQIILGINELCPGAEDRPI
jgi:hypothetical protein